jgi:uncharacterized SAM-binding protein YcdF (DUF218 family)
MPFASRAANDRAMHRFIAEYRPPAPQTEIRTIICLGSEYRTRPMATARAFREYPGVTQVIFSGYPRNIARQRDLAIEAGLPADLVVLETQATDTPENAYFTADLLGDRRTEPVLVVTNMFHLYRTKLLYEHYGFTNLHLLASDFPGAEVSADRIAAEARKTVRNWYRVRFGTVPD